MVVGPRAHVAGELGFSSRNPYATVDKNGRLLVSWVNSTAPHSASAKISWQRVSTDSGLTWGPDVDMKLGSLGGTLLGPGEGIVLGRHAPQSKYKGRIVICGATGYVGNIPGGQRMPVFTSDDDGKTYTMASTLFPIISHRIPQLYTTPRRPRGMVYLDTRLGIGC